jgi:hypothetical protein
VLYNILIEFGVPIKLKMWQEIKSIYHFSIYELPANKLDTETYGLLRDDAVKPSREVPTFLEEPAASIRYYEGAIARSPPSSYSLQ